MLRLTGTLSGFARDSSDGFARLRPCAPPSGHEMALRAASRLLAQTLGCLGEKIGRGSESRDSSVLSAARQAGRAFRLSST